MSENKVPFKYFFPGEPLDKRLKVSLDFNHRILFFGADNLYPQRMEQLRLRSPLLVSATRTLEDFINGSGWELNNDIIINDRGESARDLLNLAAMDYSRNNGFAIHLNFNALGEITEMQHVPWEYCRLGLPDERGLVTTIVVSNNWEEDSDKLPSGSKINSQWYPIFNPLAAQSQTIIPQPKGQILYFTGQERNKYPLATFDAIRDTGVTDEAIQKYESSNTSKGFHGATIMKFPGNFESDMQRG